jgi:L-ascorbate metabolism protein UlaG (beta-lactamase superfamily)
MGILIRLIVWQWRRVKEDLREATPYVPQYAPAALEHIKHPDPSRMQITWIGHSTFLIQVAGRNILTDPIWSKRASPMQWLGPKRHARPGIAFADLPKIDAVVISHTHYDHLDRPTIKQLGASPRYVLPPNFAEWFAQLGIRTVTELPWWSSTSIEEIKITAVPAKHWSKRNLWGTSDAGWGGYVIESPAGVMYFAGDTGYDPDYFKEIGKRFPHIDLALIPIGAYFPQVIFGQYHIDPREAVMVHQEVGAKKSIGMHWGTFKLTQEPLGEPPILLGSEAATAGLPADEFSTMNIGETRLF